MSSAGKRTPLVNRAQMYLKRMFHEQVEYALYTPCQSPISDEQLITRVSMYGHFPHDGLTRGRLRDRNIKRNMDI